MTETTAEAKRNRRAASTKLAPGENSIKRNTPRQRPDGVWVLDWSIAPLDGGLPITKRSQGKTKGEARRRAEAKASELLQVGQHNAWKLSDSLTEYIGKVSAAKIREADLRPNSRSRYLAVLGHLTDALRGHSIASGSKFRALESALQTIARMHGPESAHQARSVLSKYVIQQLIRDELINGNPLFGVDIDLRGEHRGNGGKRPTGQALSRDEYGKVIEHLLGLDPSEGATAPKRGRWTLADAVAKRRNVFDLTLLQAATGLRVSEAASLTWGDVEVDNSGQMYVTVSETVSKTHRGRRVPVLDSRIADRMLSRQNRAESTGGYVIGSPADNSKPWDSRNRTAAVAALYKMLATELGIPLLDSARSHVWRATLNSLLLDLPEAQRAAYFGHGSEANRQHYTDVTDVSGMVTAASRLRIVS